MFEQGGGLEDRGVARVLIMGADMPAEHALLQRLSTAAGLPEDRVAPCDDPATCDLLVVRDTSAMRNVARRMAASRPTLRFWILDGAGQLSDGFSSSPVPIDDTDVRDAMRAICAAVATPTGHDADTTPLAQAIRDRVHAGKGHAALTRDGQPLLLLDFDRRLAVTVAGMPPETSAPELAATFAGLRLQSFDAATFHAHALDLPALPLIPLLWNVALRARGPAPLLAPLDAGSVIALKQWPDFRALAHRHDHFRLCSLLLKRPSSASEAGGLLELETDTVHGFFNAAYLSGYAVITDDARAPHAVASTPKADSGGSRLARMWRNVRDRMRA